MVDIVDVKTRSRMMAGIRGKDTKPELTLRRALHAAGLRYRLHGSDLPGKPDIIFSKYRSVVFVHGCFWHRHEGCRFSTVPSTRAEFWEQKFAGNVQRDQKNEVALSGKGWRTAVVWECALKEQPVSTIVVTILKWLTDDDAPTIEISSAET